MNRTIPQEHVDKKNLLVIALLAVAGAGVIIAAQRNFTA